MSDALTAEKAAEDRRRESELRAWIRRTMETIVRSGRPVAVLVQNGKPLRVRLDRGDCALGTQYRPGRSLGGVSSMAADTVGLGAAAGTLLGVYDARCQRQWLEEDVWWALVRS